MVTTPRIFRHSFNMHLHHEYVMHTTFKLKENEIKIRANLPVDNKNMEKLFLFICPKGRQS